MRHSIERKDRIYVKGYGFLSFAKKMWTNLSNKFSQLCDTAKKSTINTIKTASKRTIQKIAEATSDFTGNEIADKITSVSKKSSGLRSTELCSKELQNNEANNVSEIPKERYISQEKRQQIIDKLMLV